MGQSFYRISQYGRDIINSNYEVDFTILGKAKSMSQFSPLKEGSLQPIEILSVLQQIGVQAIELAYCRGEQFCVIGTVTGSACQPIIDYLDNDRRCMFIGRLNSRADGIPYQQTFYVYRQGYDFAEIMRMVK